MTSKSQILKKSHSCDAYNISFDKVPVPGHKLPISIGYISSVNFCYTKSEAQFVLKTKD